MKNLFKPADPAKLRRSLRALALALVVALVCIAVNLGVMALPTGYTKLDISEDQSITLSDQSKQILATLEEDVTLYWLVTAGSENETLALLLDRYADESSHIKIEKVDLTLNPDFGQQYTNRTIYENGVVVESGEKSEYVSYYQIYHYDDTYYLSTGEVTITFEGERQLTNAIHYVTTDKIPAVYMLGGHGEVALPEYLEDAIDDENLVLQELNLLNAEAVPEDCACLLVLSPTTDFSAEDTEKVRAYLAGGGKLLLFTSGVAEGALPNLRGLLRESYGIDVLEGVVLEGSDYYYVSQPYNLVPKLESHAITDPLIQGNYLAVVPIAQPMMQFAAPSHVTISSLMRTTDAAFAKADAQNITSFTQTETDLAGPFTVGAAVESTLGTKIVWIPSLYFLEESANEQSYGGNVNLLLNALSWMCGQSESISIRAKLVAEEYFTVSAAVSRNFALAFIGVIPVAVLAVGGVVWVRRRRR